MKGKKIGTSILAAVMLAGTTAMPVLAAMPDKTVVIGEKAFSLSYANTEDNMTQIRDAVKASKGKGIFIKFNNKWFNNSEEVITDLSGIPAVAYTDGTVEKNFDAQDGDEATEGFQLVEVSASGVKKVKVVFSQAADTDKALFTVKKGNYTRNIEKVEWNEEKTEATVFTYQQIVKGDYTVSVNGLELDENTKSFKAVDEKVAEIVINEEKAPVKGGKVTVTYKKLNQYGEKTTRGSEIISGSLNNMSNVKSGVVKFDQPIDFTAPQNVMIKEMPFMVNIYCDGVNVNKTIKAVPAAAVSTLELTDIYKKLDKLDKMKVANPVEGDTEVYVKVELKDQYGNVMDKNYFGNSISETIIKNASAYKSLALTIPAGLTASFVYGTDTKDDAIYMKLAGTLKAGELRMFVAVNGTIVDKAVAVEEKVKSNNIDISLPEIYYGEKNEITEFAVYDKNGAPIEGKTLVKKLNDGLKVTVGAINAVFDEKTEKVKLTWDLTAVGTETPNPVNVKVDGITILSIQPDSMKYVHKSVPLKAKAYPVNAALKNNAMMKVRPTTSLTIGLSDMMINDQYGRTMKAEDLKDQTDITIQGSVTPAGTVDGKDRVWSINALAAGSEGTTNAVIKLAITENNKTRTEEYSFSVETVKADAIKSLKVETPEIMYNTTDTKYDKKFSVIGLTANGEKIKLAASDYGITTDSKFTTTGGKIHINAEFLNSKSEKVDKDVKFFVLSLTDAGNQTRTIKVKKAGPAIEKIEMVGKSEVVFLEGTTFGNDNLVGKAAVTGENASPEVKATIKLVDQYGVTLKTGIQNVLYTIVKDTKATGDTGIVRTKNGKADASVSNITAGDEIKVEVYTSNGKSIIFTIKK